DLDLAVLLVDLRVQHVGATAEVHDVEDVDVLAQLLLADLQLLAHVLHPHPLACAAGLDEDARERHETGEALRADRGIGPPRALAVGAAGARAPRGARARLRQPALRRGAGDDLRAAAAGLARGRLAVALLEQREAPLVL